MWNCQSKYQAKLNQSSVNCCALNLLIAQSYDISYNIGINSFIYESFYWITLPLNKVIIKFVYLKKNLSIKLIFTLIWFIKMSDLFSVVSPPYTMYMGEDKHESKKLWILLNFFVM